MAIINQHLYRDWAAQQEDLPIFFQPWWLDIVNEDAHWDAIVSKNKKSGKIEGVLPFRHKKRLGFLKNIGNPLLTPFNGPWLVYPPNLTKRITRYSFEMRVLDDLAAAIPKVHYYSQSCHYQLENWLPFYHRGFRQTTRYSYVLEDISDPNAVWTGMSKTHRRSILVAEKEMEMMLSDDVSTMYQLITEVFAKQKKRVPYSKTFFEKLHLAATTRGQAQIFLAKHKETGRIEGGIWIVRDKNSAYLMATGRMNDAPGGEVAALIWYAIRYYSGKVNAFDFEGSMIKGVGDFFRRFGGVQKPYFQLKKF